MHELPVTIAEWSRNGRETLRVRLDTFNARTVVDCRCWYADGHGELKPGRRGLTLHVSHLPALSDALNKALRHAEELGLVSSTSQQ